MVTVFIKQYGEKRTGTNLLRAIITTHFADVRVLMHILGDKHSPPAPFAAILRGIAEVGGDLGEFTARATLARPATTSAADDRVRSELLASLGAAVAESFRDGGLCFVVSIKHPYLWYASLRRFARLDEFSPTPAAHAACTRFNENYRSWLGLRSEFGRRVAIVRYEDILADPVGVTGRLAAQFGLRRTTATPITLPREVIVPTRWDHLVTGTAAGVRFDAAAYRPGARLGELSAAELHVLARGIDWDQLAEFCYRAEAA